MKRYNSIKAFLKTLNPEEREQVQWSIEALMVQYWEILTKESTEGNDQGGMTVPVGDCYLSISLGLEWKNRRFHAIVQEVKLLDNYELISKRNNDIHGPGRDGYHF